MSRNKADKHDAYKEQSKIVVNVDYPRTLRPFNERMLCVWATNPSFGGEHLVTIPPVGSSTRQSESFLFPESKPARARQFVGKTLEFFERYRGSHTGEKIVVEATSTKVRGGTCVIGEASHAE